jgi:two-component system sensor histidine kinase/response regulator
MNNKKVVLVVDDHPHNLKVLGTILNKNGYFPLFAQSGVKALSAIKNKLPDLILLDVMMPEMDGFEMCKQLKQDATLAEIPVIFLTAKTEQEDVIAGLELGAVDYVTKPFNHKELITRVSTHLELRAVKAELSQKVEELKQANTKLDQKVEEFKQANATKDKFLSIIAHDLKTPFNALLNLSSLLANNDTQLSAEKRKKLSQLILQTSDSGYHLLENLLDLSRSQTGRIQVTPATLDLKEIVEHNIELVGGNAKAKHINICSSIGDITSVVADGNMLDTVIRNLLTNAIKFTPTNGKVEISAKTEGHEVEISISDTGVGIKPEDMDKLFRMDVSFTTYGTAQEKGSGLGLILCQEFVEKNGGTIGVESQEGKGSRFYIRLPVQ